MPTLSVKALNAKHPEYVASVEAWTDIDLLTSNGYTLKRHATRFLRARPKELSQVYQARLDRFTYQDNLGTGIGWYKSALFCEDPRITLKQGANELAAGPEKDSLDAFIQDCNRGGKTFTDYFRDVAEDLLKFSCSWSLTDLPKSDAQAVSRADQEALGVLNPFLVRFRPLDVINWDTDAHGNLLWVVIATTQERRTFGEKPETVDCWWYFDQQKFEKYEAVRKEKTTPGEDAVAELVDAGPHALTPVNRVPLRRFCVESELAIAARVLLQAVTHLNMQNGYYWGLEQACAPFPWIKGDIENANTRSEVAWIQLGDNGECGYLEPGGGAFERASEELASLRQEIFRNMHLQAQGRDSSATASASSGYSKEMDMAPAVDIQNALGDVLRAAMVNQLEDVLAARAAGQTELKPSVQGFDFDEEDPADLDSDQSSIDLVGEASPTFRKEVLKSAARRKLKDAPQDTLTKIDGEIEASPDDPEAERMKQRMQIMKTALPGGKPWPAV